MPGSRNTQVTIQCQGCGAGIVLDVEETMSARCPWCREFLSIEQQMPHGAVTDAVLPFLLTREEAQAKIAEFVHARRRFAVSAFKREFTPENVMGVYLPYLVMDAKTHCRFSGPAGDIIAEHRSENTNYFDVDFYDISREFDMTVSGLTIEASSKKRAVDVQRNTLNIINAILPFDVENCVPYDGRYLKGFCAERRDTNIDELKWLAGAQLHDIAQSQANGMSEKYAVDAIENVKEVYINEKHRAAVEKSRNRPGLLRYNIRWDEQSVDLAGAQWKSAYLPVWLYSYFNRKGGKHMLHYIAVNGRTGETMGSVPFDAGKRNLLTLLVLVAFAFLWWLLVFGRLYFNDGLTGADIEASLDAGFKLTVPFLIGGVVLWLICRFAIGGRYRNERERHFYETETPIEVSNVQKTDLRSSSVAACRVPYVRGVNSFEIHDPRVPRILSEKTAAFLSAMMPDEASEILRRI
jgi:hypothetical protein